VSEILVRVGLVAGFLSFWFATPELIGAKRLQRLEAHLARLMRRFVKETEEHMIETGMGPLGMFISGLVWIGLYIIYRSWPAWNRGHPEPVWLFIAFIGPVLMTPLLFVLAHVALASLAENSDSRKRALVFGGVLFVLSWVLQFIGTFDLG
jgi:hypothetical protein